MNSLNVGCIERIRVQAIQRAQNRNQAHEEEQVLLSQEFEGILHNPLFPIAGNRRLLGLLAHRQPPNGNN